ANQDQYYIKTSENFKDYTFKFSGLTVHFRLVDASIELNNNKESKDNKRVFMLYKENEEHPEIKTIEQVDNELIIRFVYDFPVDKKRNYTEENSAKIVEAITKHYKEFFPIITPRFIDTKTNKQTKSLLDKHLETYVAKNTFDYFIHKDLSGFLNRELDFYIKSEIIHLDDLDTPNEKKVETYLAKVKAIKRVGKNIIEFLSKIEDFQKKLWLKKKFVIDTNWCITLDLIDESFYQEIIENEEQVKEWINLYSINDV
ncbi:site-specific DNA-methyltransferase, partial [Butyricicoccus sp. 1XD8-22]